MGSSRSNGRTEATGILIEASYCGLVLAALIGRSFATGYAIESVTCARAEAAGSKDRNMHGRGHLRQENEGGNTSPYMAACLAPRIVLFKQVRYPTRRCRNASVFPLNSVTFS